MFICLGKLWIFFYLLRKDQTISVLAYPCHFPCCLPFTMLCNFICKNDTIFELTSTFKSSDNWDSNSCMLSSTPKEKKNASVSNSKKKPKHDGLCNSVYSLLLPAQNLWGWNMQPWSRVLPLSNLPKALYWMCKASGLRLVRFALFELPSTLLYLFLG